MKKFLCLFLTVMILVSFVGCQNGSNDDVRGQISGETLNQNTDEPEFELGKSENNIYNNNFLGLSCTLPKEWIFYTDEQMLEINNIVGEIVDDKVAEQLQKANVFYDMFATVPAEGSSINVTMEKLNILQATALNIKATLEAQIGTLKSTYENMGYTDVNISYQKITVDNKEFDSLKIIAKVQGISFYTTMFAFKKSNYMANVSIGSLQADEIQAILSYFKIK